MAHAPVFRFTHFDHIDDIKMNIRTIGYIIGEDDKAEALVQHMERDMAQARASIPHDAPSLRVMLYGQGGYSPPYTFFLLNGDMELSRNR
jgi:ABC-type Fe3+-hydroxamate transport system substrate-binding protein